MRKTLPLCLLLSFAVSCYEEVVIPVGEGEPVLVMNAQMNNLEEEHQVLLSVSHLGKVEPLRGAEVEVYVNGAFVAEAAEISDPYAYSASRYAFKADFHPGDEILLSARKDAFSASSTAVVPAAAPISSVDTSSVQMAFMNDLWEYVQLKARFKDLPGSSWYGVDCVTVDSCDYLDENGVPIPGLSVYGIVEHANLETGFDPVISEGAGKTAGGDLTSLFAVQNSYHCFSDDPIAGQECTLRVLVEPYYYYLSEYYYEVVSTREMSEEEWHLLYSYPRHVRRECRFRLRSMDFSQYRYLKALSNLETFGGEISFLVEPTTLPSNVEGGLGFVGVETVTEMECSVFERDYPPLDYLMY